MTKQTPNLKRLTHTKKELDLRDRPGRSVRKVLGAYHADHYWPTKPVLKRFFSNRKAPRGANSFLLE